VLIFIIQSSAFGKLSTAGVIVSEELQYRQNCLFFLAQGTLLLRAQHLCATYPFIHHGTL
jgi:hypothetical protein